LLGTVQHHEACIKDLSEQIREAEVANDVPPPIKEEQVEAILWLKPPQLSAERGRNNFRPSFLLSTVTNPYSRAISFLTSRY
jgi:hypothetical protein